MATLETAEPLGGSANHAHDASIKDFVALLKPRVMSLVVFTGIAGMLLAPGTLHPFLQLLTVFCIALGSGASGAINMWYDRDIDAIMQRTIKRPLPAGRLNPDDALAFGIILAIASVALLGLATNWLAAALLASAILFYVGIYTVWLKRRTAQNIVIGGAAGAFPPVIGWAAVAGSTSLEPWLLFLIVFLWTPPHFWALALFRNEDYTRANIPMLPVTAGEAATRRQIVFYTFLMVACSLSLPLLGMAGTSYLVSASLLGAVFVWKALRVWHKGASNPKLAPQLFAYSIVYLFVLFAALVADHFV